MRHLEYAYQDWCTGNLAQLLGKEKLAQFSYESSKKVWNLWREDMKVFAPKNENGANGYKISIHCKHSQMHGMIHFFMKVHRYYGPTMYNMIFTV